MLEAFKLVGIFTGAFLTIYYLFFLRTYKKIDGEVHVRHGRLGKWEELMEHLKRKHPE